MDQPAISGPPLDYLLILDFEATCVKDDRRFLHEIIEFPCIVLQVTSRHVSEMLAYANSSTAKFRTPIVVQ